jgi:hypothetical protein
MAKSETDYDYKNQFRIWIRLRFGRHQTPSKYEKYILKKYSFGFGQLLIWDVTNTIHKGCDKATHISCWFS